MAATSLGLVGIVSKGDYSASATYIKGNFVYHNNSTWLCIAETITGSEPSENNSNWQLLAKGAPQTSDTIAPIETSPATSAYAVGEQFFYNDVLYKAKTAISVGDTLVVNTNIEASDTIVEQLGEQKGHTIKNASGTSMTDRPVLQFENGYVEDDSVNDKTIVRSTNFVGTLAQWNALSLAEQIKYKTADITDDFNGAPIDSALSDTSSNPVQNKAVKAAIDGINNAIAASYKNFIFGQYRQSDISTITITASSAIKYSDALYVCVIHSGGSKYSFGIMSALYDVNSNISMIGTTSCTMRRLSNTSFSITVSSEFAYYYVAIMAPETYTFTDNT